MQTQHEREIVRVGQNRTVTLPPSLFKRMNVREGDVFEVQTAQTMLILAHKSFVDSRIDEGLADIRAGRTQGPFSHARGALSFLHDRKRVKRKK